MLHLTASIYVGLDGCFIKLCTGAQILAATGRDGNNNMYPIAFAVVPKEGTANWCWFLTQLKYALGGEVGEFGPYTIMSDRQKVSACCLRDSRCCKLCSRCCKLSISSRLVGLD
jgi:hypothetical protein